MDRDCATIGTFVANRSKAADQETIMEMNKMIAYRLVEPQEPPQLQDVPKPSPGAGQLLVKVGGCGLCHTDIGVMNRTKAEFLDTPPPFTLGHEIAGWVAEIGQGVFGFKTGEP